VNGAKLVYRPIGMVAGALAGIAAGAVFKQLWKLAAHEDEAPEALDPDHTWGEVLAAAALQGAVFALVKAAVDRAAASGVKRVVGRWPG
jgi:Protein of unknown function (DUF4235)